MATTAVEKAAAPVSPYLLAFRDTLGSGGDALARFDLGELQVEVRTSADSIFAIVRRPGKGGLAVRVAFLAAPFRCRSLRREAGEAARLEAVSGAGKHLVTFFKQKDSLERLRIVVRFTPSNRMTLPFVPRDLYPLGRNDDPLQAKGNVEAAQRGHNAALLYFRIDEPAFGNVLYLQDLTALNDYFRATGTTPDGVVGGEWPELGYLVPTPSRDAGTSRVALQPDEPVTLSDLILVFRHEAPPHERESARQFVQMLGTAYKMLDLPPVQYRDWVERAEQSARDLAEAPEATVRHYGHLYVHPYTAGEYPDVMVQMSVIAALHSWGKWRGEPLPLEAELKKGLKKFFDPELRTMRRYLPNVGKEKDADAVDSWYLYHPLLNLGNLALNGDEDARALFMGSIEYGIRAAQHFDYRWPVQFNVTDFTVIEETAPADGRGQTDVGGVYAWVMLQAFELTDDKRYLDEAKAAIEAALGLRFNINYQANLTAWGAAACMRLWRITNREVYLEQSYVYLASFLHNCVLWDSQVGHATTYETFLAVTCLQDAPYMAMFECFDSFLAFEKYLNDSGPDLEPEARMLLSEYCKYALSRAWSYYPDALPPEVLAEKPREPNGHIDRALSFPLEDLYPDGQPAGQVGQEVYGVGAAFIFASRAFHKVEGAPFLLFCDYLLRGVERTGDRALTITLDGGETCTANLRVVRLKRRKLTRTTVTTADADAIRPHHSSDDRIDFHVPASGRLVITWD
ncbi:hypothetical protein DVW87_00710 [Sphingomonas aracearum]|uniref:Uncharacterized protein n=2 Tax=Sphingomonas aracearum TaxID=2283317 RepID=A0A369W212_9SPHN|nr:hypothetical protein DVW87_00710 [Sphingomonas aracearum]